MAVCDSSVVAAMFIPGDEHHTRSLAWYANQISDGEVLRAPNLLLIEVASAIRRATGKGELVDRAIKRIQADFKLYELTAERALVAAQVADACGVRGADAVYLALAKELNEPLITLDKQQLDRGSKVVTTHQPAPVFDR